ncbi:hypothetical protein QBC38DRAFT_464221 [Podospora fimiseda]|uniref:Store-operated calcium entry-associated regulatory factor n=1 Tax=Podospora fimiseda TaxID=252190 RepID=A0AAN7H4T6_9PEZI|nr:hypothetical protein QBC38DRAFT_464221 [Podospora fimiseda]
MRSLSTSALFGLALLWSPSVLAARPRDAILLSEVQSLTLRPASMTTGRRTSPVPQLKCVPPNSPICRLPDVSDIQTMRCRNAGSSYTSQDIQWSCTATMPSTLKLGTTNVICEGYDSPDDVYVLKGSCGVEYTLSLTDEGRHKYPDLNRGWGWGKSNSNSYDGEAMGADGYIFWVIFTAVVIWILWGACFGTKRNEARTAAQGRRTTRDDAPPPYSERWDQPSSSSYTRTAQQQQNAGWRPGFWSGMAAGGAAGYAAGARGARNTDSYTRTGTGLFGSGGTREQYYGGSSRADSQHESTGYGETRRR